MILCSLIVLSVCYPSGAESQGRSQMNRMHKDKVQAFNHCGLDKNLAQEQGIPLLSQYLNNNWQLTHQALLMLASLSDYDQQQRY